MTVDVGQVIWMLVIGLAVGWIAGLIIKVGGFGIFGDIVIGIVGGGVGGMALQRGEVLPPKHHRLARSHP